jgi:hypothetical protein
MLSRWPGISFKNRCLTGGLHDSVSQGLSLHRYSETLVLHLRFVTVGKNLRMNDKHMWEGILPSTQVMFADGNPMVYYDALCVLAISDSCESNCEGRSCKMRMSILEMVQLWMLKSVDCLIICVHEMSQVSMESFASFFKFVQ